jgi:hypothetical protein
MAISIHVRENVNREVGKCSNSTSGIGESSEITSASSSNSTEEIYSRANFGLYSIYLFCKYIN